MHPAKAVALISVVALCMFAAHKVIEKKAQAFGKQDELRNLWASWKAQYGKSYVSVQEEEYRFKVFVENHFKILRWNAQDNGSTQGLNGFADLTGEEFKATYASCHGNRDEAFSDTYCPSAVNCPSFPDTNKDQIDWVSAGAVTPVKDQGQCGSCWAFSTTGVLEGFYYINKGLLVSFSEQQIVDCASNCYGCQGCWPYLALNYTANNGIEPGKVYPYKAVQSTCKYQSNLAVKVNNGYQCVQQQSVQQLKNAVAQQPVSIAVEADQSAWQFYKSGVVSSGCGAYLDHAVLLTGYDTSTNAWTVKNSWGTSWGKNGYIYLSMDGTANSGYGVCGILRCAVIAQ